MSAFSKKTVKINQSFTCQNCETNNPAAAKTCRNHCINCLFSKHVDLKLPGDRNSDCGGLMEPVRIDQHSKKGFQIVHRCLKCGAENINKAAPDDNFEKIIEISRRQNLENNIRT